jgi:hypothetical protein
VPGHISPATLPECDPEINSIRGVSQGPGGILVTWTHTAYSLDHSFNVTDETPMHQGLVLIESLAF